MASKPDVRKAFKAMFRLPPLSYTSEELAAINIQGHTGHATPPEWARCIGSGYQSDSLYRHGRLDSCGKQWNDLKLAIEARLVQWRNPSRAKELIDSTYYKKRTTISPTAGAIWELKERPGWN